MTEIKGLLRLPKHISERMNPKTRFKSLYGIDFDAGPWFCPSCDREWTESDSGTSICECGRPLQTTCCKSGCSNIVEPVFYKNAWFEPQPYCGPCINQKAKERRGEILEQLPKRLLDQAAGDYWREDHRHRLDHTLAKWIKSDCGRGQNGHSTVYVWGSVGVGKTVSVTRAVHHLVMSGKVRSLFYCREADLVMAAKQLYGDEGPANQRMINRAKRAELLFVDEMFASPESYTDHVAHVLGDVFASRFEHGRPSIFTSNEAPLWGAVFDQRVRSRFELVSIVDQVVAPDMRSTHAQKIRNQQ